LKELLKIYPVVINFTRVENYKNGSLFERAVLNYINPIVKGF